MDSKVEKSFNETIFIDYEYLKSIFLDDYEKNLLYIEKLYGDVKFFILPHGIKLKSLNSNSIKIVKNIIVELVSLYKKGEAININLIDNLYNFNKRSDSKSGGSIDDYILKFSNSKKLIPKNSHQKEYIKSILKNDIVFGMGPAGTGKTYLAVACAIHLLILRKVEKIVLVRPAVEAGESLGFLPGDLEEKIEPYLRPLFDALYEFLGVELVDKYRAEKIIELVPLAYMRGRTLTNSFVILDEAQNTTKTQMKMFLTRLGFGSKMVINGDVSQIDLVDEKDSGLIDAVRLFNKIDGIDVYEFQASDVVRNPLVQKIIEIYNQK